MAECPPVWETVVQFGLPLVPFVNCCQFMYLVVSLLVLRAGCGTWLYQFLIIAYRFTLPCQCFIYSQQPEVNNTCGGRCKSMWPQDNFNLVLVAAIQVIFFWIIFSKLFPRTHFILEGWHQLFTGKYTIFIQQKIRKKNQKYDQCPPLNTNICSVSAY